MRTLSGPTDLVRSVAFSPDGKVLASGAWDNTIKLWDVASGRELLTLSGHTEPVTPVAFARAERVVQTVEGATEAFPHRLILAAQLALAGNSHDDWHLKEVGHLANLAIVIEGGSTPKFVPA